MDKSNPVSKSRQLWPKGIAFKVTDKLSSRNVSPFDEPTTREDVAFLQYTSGSTGEPKGVIINYGALSANVDIVHYGYYQRYQNDGGIPEEIVGFSWLPQVRAGNAWPLCRSVAFLTRCISPPRPSTTTSG